MKPLQVRWWEMLPDELLHAIATRRVCYSAYGLAEPHGPYDALGLDYIKAQSLVELAAQTHNAVVAPPCAWHIQERPEFPWLESQGVTQALCSSIPTDLFFRIVMHQIRSIDARGFHAAILVTGHYGGVERDLRLVAEYYLRRTGSPLRIAALSDAEAIEHENYRGDHAGICETSQLMYFRPDLVDLSRPAKDWPTGRWAGADFPLSDGRVPSVELGQRIVASQVAWFGRKQRELLAAFKPRENWKAPNLNETDAIWADFWRIAQPYMVCCMTLEQYTTQGFPKFPGFDALEA